MSEKLTAHYLARRAIVYVRQSSHQQLVHNRESQRRQYAMDQRVRDLGWHETEVIDEDQGRSSTSTHGRTGFQRMVADVCLGRVGAVAAIEVSLFAGCSASPCDTPRRAAAPSAWVAVPESATPAAPRYHRRDTCSAGHRLQCGRIPSPASPRRGLPGLQPAVLPVTWSRWFGQLEGLVKVYSDCEITPSSSSAPALTGGCHGWHEAGDVVPVVWTTRGLG